MNDGIAVTGRMRSRRIGDWAVALLLSAALIFSLVDRIALSLLLQPIKVALDISDAQFGLLNGIAFGIFYACMGLPMGWLVDRWSRKGTMLVGVAVWSCATLACGFATTFTALLVARILVGAGEAGLAPASYGILHSRFAHRGLGLAISIFQIGGTIGSGVGLIATGVIYNFLEQGGAEDWPLVRQFAAWQLTFILIALPGVVFLILLSLIRDRRPASPQVGSRKGKVSLIETLRHARGSYASLYFGMAGVWVATYALLSWIPAILAREYGHGTRYIGITYGVTVMIVCPIGMLVGGALSDYLENKMYRPIQVVIALAVTVMSLPLVILLAYVHSFTAVLVIVGILHFLLSAPAGIIPALIQHQSPANVRGQVSALYIMVVTLMGAGLGPALVGAISTSLPQSPGALRTAVVIVTVPALTAACLLLCSRIGLYKNRAGV